MFVPDAVCAVREMYRVLRCGGQLCVLTWELSRVEWVTRINRSITTVKPEWKRSRPSIAPLNAPSQPPPLPSLAGSFSTPDSLSAVLMAGGFAASDVQIRSVHHTVRVDDAATFFDSCMASLPSLIELSRLLSVEERELIRSHFVQALHDDHAAGQTLHLSATALMALAIKRGVHDQLRSDT